MKAAVLEELERLIVQDVPEPEMDDDSILVKVGACAICGSDIRMFHHGNNRLEPPAIMGHEASGEIVEVGKNVSGWDVGTRVSIGGDVPCGRCDEFNCATVNNCPINLAMGYQFPGSFAEYVRIPKLVWDQGPLAAVPEHVTFEEAALAEPLACCINGLEMCHPKEGETLVVIGAGPLGILLTELGRAMGMGKTIIVNRLTRPPRNRKSVRRRCSHLFLPEEDMTERILEETGGHGADVILTACPSPEAQAATLGFANHRARINLFGGLPKGKSIVPIDTNILHYKEIFLFGSHGAAPEHLFRAAESSSASGDRSISRNTSPTASPSPRRQKPSPPLKT